MEKSSTRPVRNRNRKNWLLQDATHRPVKRLFTPEIKRMLKEWLVRRRDNPYPSRDEKKTLAIETGLTYTQICNWFANWRRKLKNTSDQKKSWGNLIKNYNHSARGNVEQFSISSEDSIWGEGEHESYKSSSPSPSNQNYNEDLPRCSNVSFSRHMDRNSRQTFHNNQLNFKIDRNHRSHLIPPSDGYNHPYAPKNLSVGLLSQCFQISSTTGDFNLSAEENMNRNYNNYIDSPIPMSPDHTSKYKSHKNHIMEKYLRSFDESNNNDEAMENNNNTTEQENTKKPELSKWLESAANFTPSKNSYIDWEQSRQRKSSKNLQMEENFHEKELIAAQALELLANNFRTKFYNS